MLSTFGKVFIGIGQVLMDIAVGFVGAIWYIFIYIKAF